MKNTSLKRKRTLQIRRILANGLEENRPVGEIVDRLTHLVRLDPTTAKRLPQTFSYFHTSENTSRVKQHAMELGNGQTVNDRFREGQKQNLLEEENIIEVWLGWLIFQVEEKKFEERMERKKQLAIGSLVVGGLVGIMFLVVMLSGLEGFIDVLLQGPVEMAGVGLAYGIFALVERHQSMQMHRTRGANQKPVPELQQDAPEPNVPS